MVINRGDDCWHVKDKWLNTLDTPNTPKKKVSYRVLIKLQKKVC